MQAGNSLHLRWRVAALAVCLAAVGGGCADDEKLPETARVEGTVTWQKAPLAGATVAFVPEKEGRIASARTDEQGRYELTTYEEFDGAVVGPHRVTVMKRNPTPGPHIRNPPPDASKPLIPEKYFNASTSGLTADVKAGQTNVFDFELE